jgi:BlaI family transcriptional regulator, penicillinase repressor
MSKTKPIVLSKRERQIMDILFRLERASAAQVRGELPDPPSYSATRALLGILVNKGHVKYSVEGSKYIYRPREPKKDAGASALAGVLNTFYNGSLSSAVAGLLESSDTVLDEEEIDRLTKIIRGPETRSGHHNGQ